MSPALLSSKTQIIFAYEELSLSPSAIASQFEDYGFSEEDIKILLGSYSSKYQQDLNQRTETQTRSEGTKEELEILLEEYRHLSRASDNDLVKERALKFLINEKKGRNDIAARGLAIKEQALGMQQVDTSKRAKEFMDVMKSINDKLALTLTGTKVAHLLEKEIAI